MVVGSSSTVAPRSTGSPLQRGEPLGIASSLGLSRLLPLAPPLRQGQGIAAAIFGSAAHPRLAAFWLAVLRQYAPSSIRLELAGPSEVAALRAAQQLSIPYRIAANAATLAHGWDEECWGLASLAQQPTNVFSVRSDFSRWMLMDTGLLLAIWDGVRYGPVWDLVWLAQAKGIRAVNLAKSLAQGGAT
jgi:hypothetical protein